MITQKMIVALMIICLAVIVASILKFAEKKQIHVSTVTASLFMPILLPMFMIDFFTYVYKKDFFSLAFPKKIIRAFRLMLLEIQIAPLIHTTLIEMICCSQKESTSKFVFPIKETVEDLHVRISFANKIA